MRRNGIADAATVARRSPVASLRSWKNFWLKMNATPLISSTLASAVVFLLMKLAVMAMASFPRNSLRRNPVNAEGDGGGIRKCFRRSGTFINGLFYTNG